MKTNDQVNHARVGESTRRDARGAGDVHEMRREIEQLEAQEHRDSTRVKAIEGQLSELNHEVKGQRLNGLRYRDLLEQQAALKLELSEVLTRRLDTKRRLHLLREDMPRSDEKVDTKGERMIALLTQILAELRKLNGARVTAKASAGEEEDE
jgi:hypothetical protein